MLTAHFIKRVRERVGRDVDAVLLARHILDGLDTGDTEFMCRVSRRGLRCFRFRSFDGRLFYALIDTDTNDCVTVLPPGFLLGRHGKTPLDLKDDIV